MTDDPKKDAALEAQFWKALRKDMTVWLGLGSEIEARPMTAMLSDEEEDHGPIWFFTARDTDLGRHLGTTPQPASFHFASKGHEVWATGSGTLQLDMNRAMIDRLWNPYVAAWYEQGKDDPNLALLRMDLGHGKIWREGSSLMAGFLAIVGRDPKKDYQDNVADVSLR